MSKSHMTPTSIPFHAPSLSDTESRYMLEALASKRISGDGPFTKKCHAWLKTELQTPHALLTHSCTAALEMAALLCDLEPGDEVIMPSYTFVSTANAVALRRAVPVFIDVRPDTLNLDENKIRAAITAKTKAIAVVHYAGVAAEMDTILKIANEYGLRVIEDAAQGLMASYKGKALGTMGDFGAMSFHETKNIVSGEGGALFIKDEHQAARAEVIREKGTNRSQFFRGQVDKYTWVDIGSSYLPSDLLAALLLAQLERAEEITNQRRDIWNYYQSTFATLDAIGVCRPSPPSECAHNAHIYHLITRDLGERSALIDALKSTGIQAPFHYVPLHSSPGGKKFGRTHGDLTLTVDLSERLVRLPLFAGLEEQKKVANAVLEFYRQ
ncbi:MAG: dTDP-4-amino-4,6-dideoxygalactose transaminase [Bdellovibrionales bacterium]|jgi:dTDP-4-amino-4,6-dideoxygalactose transaminase|nr:dTDP-4-amino-4,6-dideoxygalactose transaminase [Bdellovibrionales bacterium]